LFQEFSEDKNVSVLILFRIIFADKSFWENGALHDLHKPTKVLRCAINLNTIFKKAFRGCNFY
jgi:hypothetical protein